MPQYNAPVEDALFLLNEVFEVEKREDIPGYADISSDVIEAVLGEAAKLADEVTGPISLSGDQEGCTLHADGSVTTPKGFKEAFQQVAAGGWVGMSAPEEFGGQAFPIVLNNFLGEFLAGSNLGFWMYLGLTQGAISALLDHGSPEIKKTYVPPMIAGEWTGTMNLTEPNCGTDLGLLRTKAVREDDGSFKISGTKIFISGGDHDMVDNIVHLVLARIEGAPAGVKGISLFVVPKFLVNEDGSLGEKNPVSVGSIEHKMGIHGNCTCLMNFDGARGWLVGGENRGLHAMFTMMNHARQSVGLHGIGASEAAYQNAAAYAKERLQGRALTGPAFPDKAADPLIVHPDVRRMLLTIRATSQAGRALATWSGILRDLAKRSPDEATRETAEEYVGLLTPIIKGIGSDDGFENAVMGQQIFGGHGYIVETGAEQIVRDARINQIYEGANGIQALDLAGRKLGLNDGRGYKAFIAEMMAYLTPLAADDATAPFAKAVLAAIDHLNAASLWIAKSGAANRDEVGAASYDYMRLFGLVAYGYMWCRMVETAQRKLAEPGAGKADFYQAKLATARFFVKRLLPQTATYLDRVKAGSASIMELPADAF